MRVSADPIAVLPDDCRLVSVTAGDAALNVGERKFKKIRCE
jgi:hypothetical protein